MSGPWEKFSAPTDSTSSTGPWAKFAPTPSDNSDKAMVGPKALESSPLLEGAKTAIGAPEAAAEGYTFGFGPKIEAALATPFTKAAIGGSLRENYEKNLADVDERNQTFAKDHPVINTAAEIGGTVANPLNRGRLAPAKISEALTTSGLARNTLTGAATGGATALGKSRGDAAQTAKETGKAVAEGAIAGPVAGVALRGGQKGAELARAGYDITKSGLSKGAQEAARELASHGIDVSYMTKIPDAAKGIVRGYFGNTLFGGMPVRAAATRASGQVQEAFDTQLARVGDALDAAGAGDKIHKGLEVATRAFKSQANKLYTKQDELLAPAGMPMMVKVENLRNALQSKTTPLKGLQLEKTLGDPDTQKLSQEIENGLKEASKKGRLNYQTIKAMRTAIGEKISNTPFGDRMQGYWKQLYGALSDDMKSAARAAGPEAHKAAVEADEFYKNGIAEIKHLTSKFGSKVEAENAFRSVSNLDTLRHAPARVATLFSNLPASARKTVGATVIKRLGQQGDGAEFLPGTWSNNWNKLGPSVKATLAGGKDMADELDKLSRNIERIKPLTQALPETGAKTAAQLTDLSAAASILHPSLWPVAVGKVVMDAAGGWFLTRPQNIAELNRAMETGDRSLAAKVLKKAAEHALDDDHKKMMLDAADFLVRNRSGIIGLEVGSGQQEDRH